MLPSDHLLNFQAKSKRVRRLLSRQISLSKDGRVPQTELEAIYELAFLNIFVAFENELLELLKTSVLLDKDTKGRKLSIFLPKSRTLADKLIHGTMAYIQLLPVEQLEKISRAYLKEGGPFAKLSQEQKLKINRSYSIRNYIAHKSPQSKRIFQKQILNNTNLPRRSASAGYYLKNQISVDRSYFDHHVADLGGILRSICEQY